MQFVAWWRNWQPFTDYVAAGWESVGIVGGRARILPGLGGRASLLGARCQDGPDGFAPALARIAAGPLHHLAVLCRETASPLHRVVRWRDVGEFQNCGIFVVVSANSLCDVLGAAPLRRAASNIQRRHSSLRYVAQARFASRCPHSAPQPLSATPQAAAPLRGGSGVTQTAPSY